MKTTQSTPFKNYTTMNNELIAKLGCSDVYRAYVLSLTTDKKTNSTDTTIAQLAEFCKESENNFLQVGKKESFTSKLKDTDLVVVDSKRSTSFKNGNGVTVTHTLFLQVKSLE